MYHLVKLAGLNIDQYKGDLVDGKREGFGVQIFPNGYKYTGEWKKNFAHGRGKLEYTDGTTYEGEFSKNKLQEGILSLFNGIRFAGRFGTDEREKDKFSEGKLLFKNGDMFQTRWIDGLPQNGNYINKEGVFRDYEKDLDFYDFDNLDGKYGKLILTNSEDIYEGGFQDGKQEGVGFIFSSYPHYETINILNGKLHGKYVCNYISGGYVYEGFYEHEKRVGKWKYQTVKGYFFEGDPEFKNGTVTFPYMNDDYFVGEVDVKFHHTAFKNGVYNYKDLSGKYHQIHIKDSKTRGNTEIPLTKSFNFSQVTAKLEHAKITPDKPVLNGEHTYQYPDGSMFTGNFLYDFIYVHKDDFPKCYKHSRHINEYHIDNISIKDVYQFTNTHSQNIRESKFKGTLINGLKEGECEIRYSNKSMFLGHFVNNIKEGDGTYKNEKGITFIGNYKNNELDGPVTIRKPNDDEIKTVAVKGVVSNKDVIIKKANGLLYKGDMENYVKNGFGLLTYTNNFVLEGYFHNSEIYTKETAAILTDPDGNKARCRYSSLEGRDIGILESIDDGRIYVYNPSKGSLQKAQ